MTQFFPNSPSFIEFAPFVEFGATLNGKDPLALSCPDFFIIMSQKKTYAAASISYQFAFKVIGIAAYRV